MASVHLYVRIQVNGTNEQVLAISDATKTLQAAVVDAGGDWKGGATVDLDPEPEAPPAEGVADAVS